MPAFGPATLRLAVFSLSVPFGTNSSGCRLFAIFIRLLRNVSTPNPRHIRVSVIRGPTAARLRLCFTPGHIGLQCRLQPLFPHSSRNSLATRRHPATGTRNRPGRAAFIIHFPRHAPCVAQERKRVQIALARPRDCD